MEYATQMDAARKGIYTKELLAVAEDEKIDKDELIKLVAKGQVIIPANKNHKCLKPSGIGTKLRTKINVNLGTSRDWTDLDMEMEKVKSAVDMGAEAIMDLILAQPCAVVVQVGGQGRLVLLEAPVLAPVMAQGAEQQRRDGECIEEECFFHGFGILRNPER